MCFVYMVMVHLDSSPVGDLLYRRQKWKFQLFLGIDTEDPGNELCKERQLPFSVF